MHIHLRKGPQTASGFTLVEMMIVIAIIAALVLVTVFGTKRFMDNARENKALNTMRQIGIANTQFSVDNNGDINVVRVSGETLVEGRTGRGFVADSFWGRMTPYLFPDAPYSNLDPDQAQLGQEIKRRLNGVFSTTDASKMTGTFQQKTRIYHDGAGLPVPFAFNENLAPYNRYEKTSSVSNPAQTAYMTYGWYHFTDTDFASYYEMPNNASPPSARPSNKRVDYFPSKKAAVMFVDGHIEMLTAPVPDRRIDLQ